MIVAIPSLTAAIGFALAGAWPILPLAGIELSALGGALYYVNWKLQYRHVITFDADQIRIDKGHYAPRRSWVFDRAGCALAITPEQHPWDGPGIEVHNEEQRVDVGGFLNREDALALLTVLRGEIQVRSHSSSLSRHL